MNLNTRASVRYEVALDVLGAVISHHTSVIAQERDKDAPDYAAIDRAQAEKIRLYKVRESLSHDDSAEIEKLIKEYSPIARELFQPRSED